MIYDSWISLVLQLQTSLSHMTIVTSYYLSITLLHCCGLIIVVPVCAPQLQVPTVSPVLHHEAASEYVSCV